MKACHHSYVMVSNTILEIMDLKIEIAKSTTFVGFTFILLNLDRSTIILYINHSYFLSLFLT